MSEPVARLIEHRPGRPPKVHELGLGSHTIGRVGGVDLVLDHADVSRRHAELEVTREGATIRDLASKNGVFIEGRRVSEATLDDGSRIALGDLGLVLEHPGARVDRVLLRGGEPTVRRPRSPSEARGPEDRGSSSPSSRGGVLAPALAAVVFAVLLTLLLVFG